MNRTTLSLLLVAPALAIAAGCAYQDPMSRGGDVYGAPQRVPGYYGYGAPYPPGGYYYDPRYGYYTSYRSYPYGYGYYPYGYSPPVNYCRDADRDGHCDSHAGGGNPGGGDAAPPPPRNPTLREVREEVRRQREAAQAQPQRSQQAAPLVQPRATQAEPARRPLVRRGEGRVRPPEEPQAQEP